MGIRLDWEVESEQTVVRNGKEDPQSALARRIARYRLLLLIVIVLVLFAAIGIFISYRLQEAANAIEQRLRQTVEAEVAALRLGDLASYQSLQHEDNLAWLAEQDNTFNAYQDLKQQHDIRLTGHILDVTINNRRGRVHVEEIVDGVSYTRIWFYWRFEDGWLHVPADYEFWGDLRTYESPELTVRYHAVDDPLALKMGLIVQDWLQFGCAALGCGDIPHLFIDILPIGVTDIVWAPDDPWHLLVPSPFASRARTDMPFDKDLQLKTADLIANRIVEVASGGKHPVYPADAYYLRSAVVSWLVGRFVEIDTGSLLMQSLVANYGDSAAGRLLQAMQANSNVDVFASVVGVLSLQDANLDWRDFFTWRLAVEDELIARGARDAHLQLYDTTDPNVVSTAYARFDNPAPTELRVVVLALPESAPDGRPQMRATVRVGQGDTARQEEVLFRLVNNIWKRAS